MIQSSRWRRWLDPSRILPLLTIIGAGIFLIASTVGGVSLSASEGVIITLLALIAIDALVERLQILEKIELKLNQLTPNNPLRKRNAIISPNKFAADAFSIHMIAVSAISVSTQYLSFYKRKLEEGCNIQIVLLEPNEQVLQVLDIQVNDNYNTKQHIESSIQALKSLTEFQTKENRCEIRLSKVFLPFSMVGIDFETSRGTMIVEYHGYKTTVDEQPHVLLAQEADNYWFKFYCDQFDQVWSDAQVLE